MTKLKYDQLILTNVHSVILTAHNMSEITDFKGIFISKIR